MTLDIDFTWEFIASNLDLNKELSFLSRVEDVDKDRFFLSEEGVESGVLVQPVVVCSD